jgi:diguanylate cyclase (GGDEF)-like protein
MSTGKTTKPAPDSVEQDSPRPAARRRIAKPRVVPVADIPDEELTPQVRTVVSTLVEEVERLRRDLARSERRAAELAGMVDADPLLGILNRRAFERELGRAMANAQRYATTLSVIYFDLDDFKATNDRYGHAVGDAVLRRISAVLVEHVRKSDIVGRLGGDEFAVALVQADRASATAKARQLVAAIASAPVACAHGAVVISATAGVAELADGEAVESLIDRADRDMYGGKRRRRA